MQMVSWCHMQVRSRVCYVVVDVDHFLIVRVHTAEKDEYFVDRSVYDVLADFVLESWTGDAYSEEKFCVTQEVPKEGLITALS